MSMLTIRSVHYSYSKEKTIVYPDFELLEKELLFVKGPSGSGKSTLMYLISGLLPIQKGVIRLFNSSVNEISSQTFTRLREKTIGLTFQRNHFLPALTVLENLRVNPNSSLNYLHHLAERLHIHHELKKKPFELSQGELQRAALIRALVHRPKLVLADEPTSNLDAETCSIIYGLFEELIGNKELALIISTHDERLNGLTRKELYLK